MAQQYGDFQLEIYRAGTKGVLPRYPVDHAGLERKAAEALPPWILSYVAGGCGNEHTQRANVAAFEKWGIVPRMFNGSYERDLSIELFGMRLPTPLFTVPIGIIGVCSQDFHGDLQVARAAARTGVPVMQSTLSMDPMEDLVPAMGDTPGFFQLYTPKDRDLAVSLIQRAEAAGYKAIAVTLDTWVTGWRPRDLNAANFPQLRGYCLANYFTDEHFLKRLAKKPAGRRRRRGRGMGEPLRLLGHLGRPEVDQGGDQPAHRRQGHQSPRRRPQGHRPGRQTASTARTTADGRRTVGCPRWTCCPTSSKPPTACPSSSTPECGAAPTR